MGLPIRRRSRSPEKPAVLRSSTERTTNSNALPGLHAMHARAIDRQRTSGNAWYARERNLRLSKDSKEEVESPLETPMTTFSQFIHPSPPDDDWTPDQGRTCRKNQKFPEQLKLVPDGAENAVPTQRQFIEAKTEQKLRKMMYRPPLISPSRLKESNYRRDDGDDDEEPRPNHISKKKIRRGLNLKFGSSKPTAQEPGPPLTPSTPVAPKAAVILGEDVTPKREKSAIESLDDTPTKAAKLLGINDFSGSPDGSPSRSKRSRQITKQQEVSSYHSRARILKSITSSPVLKGSPIKTLNILTLPSGQVVRGSRDNALKDVSSSSLLQAELSGGSLVRSHSLKYIDNEAPPTPPEKDTLPRRKHAVRPAIPEIPSRDARRVQSSSRISSVFGDTIIVNDKRHSPTKSGGRLDSSNVMHKPSIYSMKATIEGDDYEAYLKTDGTHDASIYRGREFPDDKVGSRSNDQAHSWNRQSRVLDPAFYTPSLYSAASEQKDFRPSHNQDSDIYQLPFSERIKQGVSVENDSSNSSSPVPTPANTKQGLTPMMHNMLNNVIPNIGSGSDRHEAGLTGKFQPQFPSAMPTPLYQNGSSPEVPRTPIVPPEDILTHFDILNRHLLENTQLLHEAIQITNGETNEELRRQHRQSISVINEQFAEVLSRLDGVGHDFGRTRGELLEFKHDVSKKIENLAETIQTDMVRRLDEVLFSNAELGKKVAGLAARVESMERKQQDFVDVVTLQRVNPNPVQQHGHISPPSQFDGVYGNGLMATNAIPNTPTPTNSTYVASNYSSGNAFQAAPAHLSQWNTPTYTLPFSQNHWQRISGDQRRAWLNDNLHPLLRSDSQRTSQNQSHSFEAE